MCIWRPLIWENGPQYCLEMKDGLYVGIQIVEAFQIVL